MTDTAAASTKQKRLVYAPASELDRWGCHPLGAVDILDLRDRRVGVLDGVVFERPENRPAYIVVASGNRSGRVLVPVGDAWFDDTERAIRIDLDRRERVPFDPAEFARMTLADADEYERRVLAACCPEVGFHRDGRPDYARQEQFKCPAWLRPEA